METFTVMASEPWYCRYDTGTPAKGQVLGPKHGQLTASRHYYGLYVLGHNVTVCGNNATLVRWRGIQTVYGKIDDSGTIAIDATCTVSVWKGDRSGDTTMNVTATNRFASLSSVNGKECTVVMGAETPELIAVKCS